MKDFCMTPEGFTLEQVEEINSTSEALKARAAEGAPDNLALLARRQTGGHGRMGRPWRSIEGNLLLSVLMRPATLRYPGHWSILAAVALAEAVTGLLPNPALLRVKWPNDLLLDGGKLAGILLEAGFAAAPWLVAGFGVNLAEAPDGLGRQTACLADVTRPPSPEEFAGDLLAALQRWRTRYEQDGFAPVRDAWLAIAHRPGDLLIVGQGDSRIEGRFRGIGDDAALLLDGADGPITIAAGEVA
jgi:BirA family biotin operon repressor/biotin-[acetyl-CoA-carboxylase] ligase